MPMDFPDMDSLKRRASVHGFREPKQNESENEYRQELADFVKPIDQIESMEIRAGRGWDKWSEQQQTDCLIDAMGADTLLDIAMETYKEK